jgi:hypothetical protein
VTVRHIEHQDNLRSGLCDKWLSPFMATGKLGFIMDQHASKSNFLNNCWWKPLISNFNRICEAVDGMHGEVYLLSYED